MKNTVLPPNSRFLGPGISRELKVRSLTTPNSLDHYCAYSIGNPWISSFQEIDMKTVNFEVVNWKVTL